MRARAQAAQRKRQITLGAAAVAVAVIVYVVYRLLQPSPVEQFESALEEGLPRSGEASLRVEAAVAPGTGLEDVVVTGDGSYTSDGAAADVTFDFSATPNAGGAFGSLTDVPITYEDSTLYVNVPQLDEFLDIEDPWIKIDPDHASYRFGGDIGVFHVIPEIHPVVLVHSVQAGAGSATEGTENELEGEGAAHVTFPVDVSEAAESAPPELAGAFDLLTQDFGVSRGEGQAWLVDREIARVQVTYDMLIARNSLNRSEVSLIMDFGEPGTPSDITVPSPASVVDVETLARKRDRSE